MKNLIPLTLLAFVSIPLLAGPSRIPNAALDCEVLSPNAGIARVRFMRPENDMFAFRLMDLTLESGETHSARALAGGIRNQTNQPFAEVSVFETPSQGPRLLTNVFSYSVRSEYDRNHPHERGGYTGMHARLITPFAPNTVEILCEPITLP
ncbi:MAG TPA: hypothetical protein VM901_09590 [Bdellovibrionota bacterium]|nr:hypothetical protein [Bdellovibrionota bacterium]